MIKEIGPCILTTEQCKTGRIEVPGLPANPDCFEFLPRGGLPWRLGELVVTAGVIDINESELKDLVRPGMEYYVKYQESDNLPQVEPNGPDSNKETFTYDGSSYSGFTYMPFSLLVLLWDARTSGHREVGFADIGESLYQDDVTKKNTINKLIRTLNGQFNDQKLPYSVSIHRETARLIGPA